METTHTTRVVVAVCAVLAVAAFIGGYYFKSGSSDKEEAEQSSSPTPLTAVSPTPTGTPTPIASAVYKPSSHTVKLTSQGLAPVSLSIRAGDTVLLRNDSDVLFWPASNPHPTHTDCPGFNTLRGLTRGESYTLTFTKVQVCGYHNHLDPANGSMWGTITVR